MTVVHFLIAWMTIGALFQLMQYAYTYSENPELTEKLIRWSFSTPRQAGWTTAWILLGWPFGVWLNLSGSRLKERLVKETYQVIRREVIDGPKWKAALADQPRPTLEMAHATGFSWGPSENDSTCSNLTPEGLEKMWAEADEDGVFPFAHPELFCGKPAVVTTKMTFDNAPNFEVDYCEECRPPVTRECAGCGGRLEGPPHNPFCLTCPEGGPSLDAPPKRP
jgi:hypothetical protein